MMELNTQQKLDELQERYHLVVTGTDVGIWDWDIKNSIVFYSDCWKSM
jgi:hypothetical protein